MVVARARSSAQRWREVDERVRQCLLDWLGVILAADVRPLARSVRAAGRGSATDLRTGDRLPPQSAARVNAAYAHQLDFDDFHLGVPGHASAAVIGAALATAESRDAALGELFAAITAGVEAVVALGSAYGAALFTRGWHPTAVLGSIGAAIASAQLFGADTRSMKDAVGLAGLQASGTMAGFGSIGKPWQVGCAARNGVEAAVAAVEGSWTLPDVLSGPSGVLRLMTDVEEPDLGTGERIAIADTQFKYYATCFGTHAAIRAAQSIARSHEISPETISSVDVAIGRDFEHVVINPAPSTLLQAKFSVSAVVAMSLLGMPPVVPDFFSDEISRDPAYRSLEAATRARAADDIDGGGARVVVTTRRGDVYERLQAESRPTSAGDEWPAVEEKFRVLAGSAGAEAEQVRLKVREADEATPVSDLISSFNGLTGSWEH
ncbi:MmgE/PrpD family protein [Microbacterium soli]|uniref:MmgE/PrpD family protein n=1 Tax=Microbacterium soli TaxID=446075 RepID=UPI0031CE7758